MTNDPSFHNNTHNTHDNRSLRAYFVTGTPRRPLEAGGMEEIANIACAAARGGAGTIQVRSKPISTRNLYNLTKLIAQRLSDNADSFPHRPHLLINDRVDIALALTAEGYRIDGVHLGQDDLPVTTARTLLGSDAIIGLTTGTLDLVHTAQSYAHIVNYIGAGPFRPTPTKDSGRQPLGLKGYAPLVQASDIPIVAIGDVQATDAPALAATGIAGCAVVRGFMQAEDPEDYARRICESFGTE